MSKIWSFCIIIFLTLCIHHESIAQEKKKDIKLGFNFGMGTQESFPFNSPWYRYESKAFKFQINSRFIKKRKWSFEWLLEPSFFLVNHQLLIEEYITPDRGEDYLEQRAQFTKRKTIKEYVLNVGIVSRYHIFPSWSVYAIGSVGPMIMDTQTERQAKGFAFSDVFAIGLSKRIGKIQLDFRAGLRHVSNAGLKAPNGGHNSSTLEIGFVYAL